MFDIGWSELLVIGIVALVVIGPKELPALLRTLGQGMTKIRRMASDFQSQFNDAMREAEIDELKKQAEKITEVASYNPIDKATEELRTAIESPPEQSPAKPAETPAPTSDPVNPAESLPAPEPKPDAESAAADSGGKGA